MYKEYHPINCRCSRCASVEEFDFFSGPSRNKNTKKIKFSWREIWALSRALIGITLAVTIFLTVAPSFRADGISGILGVRLISFISSFGFALGVVGSGFILHELAHKFVAQRYGYAAEFKAFDVMILFAMVIAFFSPLIFLAPGAVVVSGLGVNKRESGIISAAGPLVNIVLGTLAALLFVLATTLEFPSIYRTIGFYGMFVNGWLALFNLIPFLVLDGKKIMTWDPRVWVVLTLLAVAIVGYAVIVLWRGL